MVGVHRVNEPDELGFPISRVDPYPRRPDVVTDKCAHYVAHIRVKICGVTACCPYLINVDDQDSGVLLVGKHDVLAPT